MNGTHFCIEEWKRKKKHLQKRDRKYSRTKVFGITKMKNEDYLAQGYVWAEVANSE